MFDSKKLKIRFFYDIEGPLENLKRNYNRGKPGQFFYSHLYPDKLYHYDIIVQYFMTYKLDS